MPEVRTTLAHMQLLELHSDLYGDRIADGMLQGQQILTQRLRLFSPLAAVQSSLPVQSRHTRHLYTIRLETFDQTLP